ncbi:choline transporter-like protein 1 [Liolophura sinensis]|uniref:choline transporter-like protein 1 n=1 Tax=Liolophura sinensis TaxID=3198878 RepID=UPI003157F976
MSYKSILKHFPPAAYYLGTHFIRCPTAYQTLEELLKTPVITDEVRTWLIYASCTTVVTFILIIILLFLRKRIGLVVQLFREAGCAVRRIPMILFQPMWTLITIAATVAVLVVVALYVETAGTPSLDLENGFGINYDKDETWQVLRWYYYFGALWITAFIFACQDVIIAGAVATWYFNREKRSLGWPIYASTWRLFRYHLGSVAFGSLIIAIIRFIRLMLAYIQRQLKGRTGKVAQFLLKMMHVCLLCFEKFIAFLNRNAYIEVAIYGHSFCTAAKKAFMLIVSNVVRVAVINSIGDFILFLAKLIPIGVVIVAGRELLKDRPDVSMIAIPIALVACFTFAISHCFIGVYEMVIDTIFICFCEDCEQNDGDTKPYYMSKGLMKYMNASKKMELGRKKKSKTQDNSKSSDEDKK